MFRFQDEFGKALIEEIDCLRTNNNISSGTALANVFSAIHYTVAGLSVNIRSSLAASDQIRMLAVGCDRLSALLISGIIGKYKVAIAAIFKYE